jgi:hypothetical protein
VRAPTVDQAAGTFFAAFSLAVLWETRKIPLGFLAEPGPGAMPMLLAIVLLVCSLALVVGGGSARRLSSLRWEEWRHALFILGTCSFMALAIERLGYRLTVLAALLVLVSVLEKRGWIAGLAFAAGFSFGSYYVFHSLLQVPLPQGPLGL